MTRARPFLLLLALSACVDKVELERRLSSFEVTLFSPVGTPQARCILAGTPTAGVDLTGCPIYESDAAGQSVVRVAFEARAVDNQGQLLETYDNLATVRVVPGQVDPGFRRVRFTGGLTGQGANRPSVAFRGAFADTFLWIADEEPPTRGSEGPGLGAECTPAGEVCTSFGLGCISAAPSSASDPSGRVYCTRSCDEAAPCPEGYRCSPDYFPYEDGGDTLGDSVCVRAQPTYAAGIGGPIHFVEPALSDINRSDSLVNSPFIGQFIEVKRGAMIVTAVRIDGFYVTDLDGRDFNHLFVFNFSRPEDLYAGDKLLSVAGPVSEFNGLTELNFPLWEVDLEAGTQPIPPPISLHTKIIDLFPELVVRGAPCFNQRVAPEEIQLLDCAEAGERVEAARVSVQIARVLPIVPGSREEENLQRFGQWPVVVNLGSRELTIALITRDNIPFFDPRLLPPTAQLGTVTGNLRQVAFDDQQDPIWIVEPRDQADCTACVNP